MIVAASDLAATIQVLVATIVAGSTATRRRQPRREHAERVACHNLARELGSRVMLVACVITVRVGSMLPMIDAEVHDSARQGCRK